VPQQSTGIWFGRCRGTVSAWTAALLVLACTSPWSLAAETTAQVPNIIFVLTDDQRYDALGILDSRLNTPNLDRLATEGVLFENAFVTTSLFSPSRASNMSGQAMRHHGVVDNNSPMPDDFEPFAVALDAAGYDTAFIGKWHMGRYPRAATSPTCSPSTHSAGWPNGNRRPTCW